jgi:hypothetical protein
MQAQRAIFRKIHTGSLQKRQQSIERETKSQQWQKFMITEINWFATLTECDVTSSHVSDEVRPESECNKKLRTAVEKRMRRN